MSVKTTDDVQSASEGRSSVLDRIKHFVDTYIFPGKLFPCYRKRIGENGEILQPPTLNELLRYEADNAKGDFLNI